MGRRVKKTVSAYVSSTQSYNLSTESLFIYDGWNLIAEITTPYGQPTTTKHYVWGQDLSQSIQGAGGIGGLIAAVNGADTRYFCYDVNGNVGQLVDGSDGTIAAHYEYDPYGNVLLGSGTEASDNPFKFSTKYSDVETALIYYGYRHYTTELGRWLNKDPIAENGGLNLYLMVLNDPINFWDYLGMAGAKTHGVKGCKPDDDCVTLKYKMGNIIASLKERREEMIPFSTSGQSWKDYVGHAQQIAQQGKMIMKCHKLYKEHKPPCCDDPGGKNLPYYNPYPLPEWKPDPYKPSNASLDNLIKGAKQSGQIAKKVTVGVGMTLLFIVGVITGATS